MCNSHSVGLKKDGTVIAIGDNRFGACNVGHWTDIVAIAADGQQTVGLKADGTVVVCGQDHGQLTETLSWRNIAAIYALQDRVVGIKTDGSIVVAGFGDTSMESWTGVKQLNRQVAE